LHLLSNTQVYTYTRLTHIFHSSSQPTCIHTFISSMSFTHIHMQELKHTCKNLKHKHSLFIFLFTHNPLHSKLTHTHFHFNSTTHTHTHTHTYIYIYIYIYSFTTHTLTCLHIFTYINHQQLTHTFLRLTDL
jgi:hypothetical protein